MGLRKIFYFFRVFVDLAGPRVGGLLSLPHSNVIFLGHLGLDYNRTKYQPDAITLSGSFERPNMVSCVCNFHDGACWRGVNTETETSEGTPGGPTAHRVSRSCQITWWKVARHYNVPTRSCCKRYATRKSLKFTFFSIWPDPVWAGS